MKKFKDLVFYIMEKEQCGVGDALIMIGEIRGILKECSHIEGLRYLDDLHIPHYFWGNLRGRKYE